MKNLLFTFTGLCLLLGVILAGLGLLLGGCDGPKTWSERNQKIGEVGGEIEKSPAYPYDIKARWRVRTNFPTVGGLNQVVATNIDSKGLLLNISAISSQPIPPETEVVFTYLSYRIGASGGTFEAMIAEKIAAEKDK